MKKFAEWFSADPWRNMGYIMAGIVLVLLVASWFQ